MNHRFHCPQVNATVTDYICGDRVAVRAIDCAGCHKMNGAPPAILPETKDVQRCSARHCDEKAKALGLCERHYANWYYRNKQERLINGGEKMKRANKKCGKCGTEASSNRAEKCNNCGEEFPIGKAGKREISEAVRKRVDPRLLPKPETRNPKPSLPIKGSGSIVEQLMQKRAVHEAAIAEIDADVKVLRKYGA